MIEAVLLEIIYLLLFANCDRVKSGVDTIRSSLIIIEPVNIDGSVYKSDTALPEFGNDQLEFNSIFTVPYYSIIFQ